MSKTKSAKSTVTMSVIGLLVLVALGTFRLQLGRAPGDGSTLSPLKLSECMPAVDVATGVAVTLGHMGSFGRPQVASTPVSAAQTVESAASAPKLSFRTTGPLEIRTGGILPAEGKDVPLANQEIVLSKANPSFAMVLPEGQTALIQRGASVLKVSGPARFGPADDTEYPVTLPRDSTLKAVVIGGKAVVPTGTVLANVSLTAAQSVVPLQPLRASIWLNNPVPTLTPMRVSGQPGLADLKIELGRSTLQTEPAGASPYVCVYKADQATGKEASKETPSGEWLPAGIAPQPAGSRNGQLSIAIPSSTVPADTNWQTPVWLAIGTSDGQKVAIGGVQFVGRAWAGAIGTALTLILLGVIMYNIGQRKKDLHGNPRWFAGLFIGPDGDPSLSLLQMFIWTTITIWGFFYVFIVAGDLLALTPEMMSLLGIAGVGTVLARWIAVSGGGSTSQPATTVPATPAAQTVAGSPSGNDFWRMLSTHGHFDLLKLQLFAFTVVIAVYVVWRIADAGAFPTLDTSTLLLLGVSQGVYVSSKLVGTTALASLQATKAQLDLNATTAKSLAAQKAELNRQLAAANGANDTKAADALKAPMDALDVQIADNKKEGDILTAAYDSGLAKLGLKQA